MSDSIRTIPYSTEEIKKFEKVWNESNQAKHFGAQISLSDDTVSATIEPLMPFHRGGLGTEAVNGMVLAGLFDLVIGTIGVLQKKGQRAGTAQLSMFFFRPVLGNKITARARMVRGGGNLIFCEASIVDGQGKECARCDGIVGVSSQTVKNSK